MRTDVNVTTAGNLGVRTDVNVTTAGNLGVRTDVNVTTAGNLGGRTALMVGLLLLLMFELLFISWSRSRPWSRSRQDCCYTRAALHARQWDAGERGLGSVVHFPL